jgi:hypothetical protein
LAIFDPYTFSDPETIELFPWEHKRRSMYERNSIPIGRDAMSLPVGPRSNAMKLPVRELTADELDFVSGATAADAAKFLLANAIYGSTGALVAFIYLKK